MWQRVKPQGSKMIFAKKKKYKSEKEIHKGGVWFMDRKQNGNGSDSIVER